MHAAVQVPLPNSMMWDSRLAHACSSAAVPEVLAPAYRSAAVPEVALPNIMMWDNRLAHACSSAAAPKVALPNYMMWDYKLVAVQETQCIALIAHTHTLTRAVCAWFIHCHEVAGGVVACGLLHAALVMPLARHLCGT